MTTFFKIRFLLFLLALSFVATAISINLTFRKEKILEFDAKQIENNLHKKEKLIKDFLNNSSHFKFLQSLDKDEVLATNLIKKFRDEEHIYVHTYYNNKLTFWGSNTFVPETDLNLKEGSNFIKWKNGWYEAIKRSSRNFSAVCILPIKENYPFRNDYLKNQFSADLISSNNVEIANINDVSVYNIRNLDGKYLFPVKLKPSITNSFYSTLELWMWVLAIAFGSIFVTSVCVWIASKGYTKTAIGTLFIYFLVLRILNLQSTWFYQHFNIPIFDPQYYSGGPLFPSLGDFLLNLLACTWFLCFVFTYRHKIKLSSSTPTKPVSYIVFFLFGAIIGLIALQLNHLFFSLVTNSKINFDLTNILDLNGFSWLGIILLCIAVLNLYIVIEVILQLGKNLPLTLRERFGIFLTGFILLVVYELTSQDFDIVFLILSLVILVRGYMVYSNKSSFNLAVFIFIILGFAIIASIKLSKFQFFKEREQRKIVAQRLQSANDPNAVSSFLNLESTIVNDPFIVNYFKSSVKRKYQLIEKLNESYFDGYLAQYDFKTFAYANDGAIYNLDSVSLSFFKNLVISKSIKVSKYFYQVNNSFGYQNYFAILPIQEENQKVGTLVLELKSKIFQKSRFPEVLNNSKIESYDNFNNYSVAFYNNDQLLYQNGQYIYSLKNELKAKPKSFIFIEKNGFNHLVYQSNSSKIIIVSKPVINWMMQIAATSFLFLVLLTFTIIVILIYWLTINFRDHEFRIHLFNWNYIISQNQILYRTRIQASMVIAIISTLLIIGIITFLSVQNQFREQQQSNTLDKINQIVDAFEKKMFENGRLVYDDPTLRNFADINATDLNLYNKNGKLIFTTQPKIYEYGLITPRLNALAYIYLNRYQRSEYLNREQIGNLYFFSAYKPIRNENNETTAYLSLPFYGYEREIESQIGSFLNTLINVYALVLVTIGLFAVFVANKITYPLTIVQESLAQIKIGSKNEPINWKRNDEIGSLIKEYNNMIVALEESAQKLARSERESAWREMAKQVAHEIKNPLTPLKLGVQLLEKSWKEKDPNFDKKFEKFSKSFIEQIESLSLIASEFSNFAKMTDTTFYNVDLSEIIERSVEAYSNLTELTIKFDNQMHCPVMVKGDKDQLLKVFNNLIKNAIEAIPDYKKGSICIVLKQQNGQAQVQLQDNGNGIPENLRERIFHPNFTTKSSGTGLGLAFVKQAIENMMGSIDFETEDNKGTTFYISIPLSS